MKKFLIIITILFIQCTSSIQLQPHMQTVGQDAAIDSDAGIYISPEDLTNEHTKFNLLIGSKIRVPLGTPLRDLSHETFLPFFNRVYNVGSKNYKAAPYIIEVSMVDFRVTTGMDTHLVIKCRVSTEDQIIFSDTFKGSGKGLAAVGLLDDDDLARDQIRKSAELAFVDAFEKMQHAFEERISNN